MTKKIKAKKAKAKHPVNHNHNSNKINIHINTKSHKKSTTSTPKASHMASHSVPVFYPVNVPINNIQPQPEPFRQNVVYEPLATAVAQPQHAIPAPTPNVIDAPIEVRAYGGTTRLRPITRKKSAPKTPHETQHFTDNEIVDVAHRKNAPYDYSAYNSDTDYWSPAFKSNLNFGNTPIGRSIFAEQIISQPSQPSQAVVTREFITAQDGNERRGVGRPKTIVTDAAKEAQRKRKNAKEKERRDLKKSNVDP